MTTTLGDTSQAAPARTYVAERIQAVPPSGIRRFFDIAATMEDVISLGIGEPDFVTPAPIVRAGIASLAARRDALHLQLRHPGAAPGAERPSQTPLRRGV